MNKICIICKESKELDSFYKHKQMSDGHLNKCVLCCKKQAIARRLKLLNNPIWASKEAERQRLKNSKQYYRIKNTDNYKKRRIPVCEKYDKNHPEKRLAIMRANANLERVPCGYHKHHWSYLEENWLNVFILSIKDHKRIHRYMTYVPDKLCYKTKDGILLDTREKHEKFMNNILQTINQF